MDGIICTGGSWSASSGCFRKTTFLVNYGRYVDILSVYSKTRCNAENKETRLVIATGKVKQILQSRTYFNRETPGSQCRVLSTNAPI